jgi:ribose 5-phosphate isomerase B
MRLVVGGDHAGYTLKAIVVGALRELGHLVDDVGSHDPNPVDFPDIARAVGEAVRSGRADRGVLVCGTGIGACIAANKIPGIRGALCHDVYSAHQCVEHDDANVLCLGAQIVGDRLALDLLKTYLAAEYRGDEPFRRRLAKLTELEREAVTRSPGEWGPKLDALVADLAKLAELDRPELEPATPWSWHEDDDDQR